MSSSLTPYTFIQCPCSDSSVLSNPGEAPSPSLDGLDDDDDNDRTFDPRAPRSNYSLYPLEYLLYCEDCHQIRCPRCVTEEIVAYFCPSCLFEVPTSNIKSEGNRCTRSCFQCPICIGPLVATAIDPVPNPGLLAADNATAAAAASGPYALICSYCQWSSTEVGIKFEKSNGLYAQLMKMRNGGKPRLTPRERKLRDSTRPSPQQQQQQQQQPQETSAGAATATTTLDPVSESPPLPPPAGDEQDTLGAATAAAAGVVGEGGDEIDVEAHFSALKSFYQSQLSQAATGTAGGLSALGDLGFSSPGSLSRIMSLYTSGSGVAEKRAIKARASVMREATEPAEGLVAARLDERAAVARLHREGYHGTASANQQAAQGPSLVVAETDRRGASARFLDSLRPIPYLLRTKRSKRCSACRHIMSKPEAKIGSNRFRIRLVAGSYIPSISIRALGGGGGGGSSSAAASASASTPATAASLLEPLKPIQYLLTFKNPIFETVKVTLATPATTPGRFASKVTVLCPQFEIDANTDVWDEALKDGDKDRRRRKGEEAQHQAEAGKIWERGRNWVSIVVEVVPSSLRLDALALGRGNDAGKLDLSPLREDEDLLEIPMFVRVEWEADPANDDVGTAPGRDREAKEKRELAYWCVLGVGRISQD